MISCVGGQSQTSLISSLDFQVKHLCSLTNRYVPAEHPWISRSKLDLVGGFSPTHLKNMIVMLGIFPKDRGENKKYLKPSPRGSEAPPESQRHLIHMAISKSRFLALEMLRVQPFWVSIFWEWKSKCLKKFVSKKPFDLPLEWSLKSFPAGTCLGGIQIHD